MIATGKKFRGKGLWALGMLAAVVLVMSPFSAKAQMQTTTGINGTVADSSGGLIVGAVIIVRDQQTGAVFNTKTNSSGYYSFPSILPGLYTITASMAGFRKQEITDRQVQATQPATVDVTLEVGSTAQTVTVSAQGAELLTTSSQAVTGTITPMLVQNLTNIRGNFFDVLTLAPGVVPQGANGPDDPGSFVSQTSKVYNYVTFKNTSNVSGVFVGGNRDSGSNVSVDGSNVQGAVWQDAPQLQSTDSIQELRVETVNMSAEFGYGASGVNVITKSGTNQLHGDVYEYLRNNHLDANDFFSNLNGQELPVYQQNRFGASVGGPIMKDKLLFFANYEGQRIRQTDNVQAHMVPDTYRSGDFSVNANSTPDDPLAAIPIYNPYQFDPVTGLREQFPNNQIPLGATTLCAPHPTCGDPVTLAYLNKYVMHPNAVVDQVPVLQATERHTLDANQFTGRIDWLKSSATTIYGRYTQTPSTSVDDSYESLQGATNNWGSWNSVAHWIQVLGSNTVNHFFVGYSRPTWYNGRKLGVPDVTAEIGLKNTSDLPGGPDFINGYDMNQSSVNVLKSVTNTYQLQDDLSMVKGRHDIKFGVSLIDKRSNYNLQSDDKGVFRFSGGYTSACPTGNATCEAARGAAGVTEGGLAFADYLLGATSNTSAAANYLVVNAAPYAAYQLYSGFYAQDSWRVTTRLTVNAGLRYEHWTPWLVPRNNVTNSDPTNGNPVYVLQNPLDYLDPSACYGACGKLNPNVPRAGYSSGSNDFAPRFGLAYSLGASTVLRASFGIYYDGNTINDQLSQAQTGAPPFSEQYQQLILPNETPVPTYTVSTMFPTFSATAIPQPNSTPVQSYLYVEPHLPTAAVDEWSFDVQQRVGKIWGLDIAYVGSHTTHEFQRLDTNAPELPLPGTPAADLTLQERRPFPGWGQLGTWSPIGWGRYNGLVASFKNSNPWHNLTLITNFQWSKNIVSSYWGRADRANENFRQPYIWAGNSPTAQPGRLVVGYNYQLPFGRGKAYGSSINPILDRLVSGWSVSGISTFAKGTWASIRDTGKDTSGTGESHMPYRICNPNNVPGGRSYLEWWNPACLEPATFGTNGNTPLDAFTVPGINNWQISIAKFTRTGFPRETGEIQFRADMYNAFNHTQWATPDQSISDYSDVENGRIFSTRPSRQIQLSLRYIF
jgi:Carboxypeptidase regulatory-like domain